MNKFQQLQALGIELEYNGGKLIFKFYCEILFIKQYFEKSNLKMEQATGPIIYLFL